MAKTKLPLLGIEASGSLGKAITYFNWKGINAVRSHAIPANPNTAAQQGVRTDFTTVVGAWHHADMNADDKSAWNRFAGIVKRAASGFNEFVAFFCKVLYDGDDASYIRDHTVVANAAGTVSLSFETNHATGRNIPVYWGTSKTFMPNTADLVEVAGAITGDMTPLVVGTKYFYYVKENVAGIGGRTGIFEIVAAP